MADEKQFTINVRSEILKKPLYKRGKKAVTAVKEATEKAMHVKKVKIGPNLNHLIWSQGKHNPPTRFKVHSIVEEDYARVELVSFEFEKNKEKKAPEAKGLKEKIQEKLGAKEQKTEEKAKQKELSKEELAIEKKEHLAHHPAPGEPGKYKTEEQTKMDKVKGIVAQDKKKDIGEK